MPETPLVADVSLPHQISRDPGQRRQFLRSLVLGTATVSTFPLLALSVDEANRQNAKMATYVPRSRRVGGLVSKIRGIGGVMVSFLKKVRALLGQKFVANCILMLTGRATA